MPNGYFAQNDPFSFSLAFLSAGSFFGNSGLSIDGNPASGNLWVNLPRSTYIKLQGGKKLLMDKKILSASDAQSFKRFFENASNSAQIPWILGPLSLITFGGIGTVITVVAFTIDGLQRISRPPIDSDQLSVLMSDGGSFARILGEEASFRITASILYSVKVGNEVRTYGISSSTYGLNVVNG